MNKVILTGNICNDIEIRSAGETSVLTNTIAVKRDRKNQGGEYECDFIQFEAWRNNADYLYKFANKGDLIEIDGKWQVRKWQDNSGNNRVSNECVVDNVRILKSTKERVVEEESQEPIEDTTISDSDLPF